LSAAFKFSLRVWRILSRTSHRDQTGPRCAPSPSIPLVAHGFTTTQPPLARRLARFALMRFAQRFTPHFAETPGPLCPSLLGYVRVLGFARVLVPSIFSSGTPRKFFHGIYLVFSWYITARAGGAGQAVPGARVQARAHGCPVGTPRAVMNIKHPCK
jgi:hypothetical protein